MGLSTVTAGERLERSHYVLLGLVASASFFEGYDFIILNLILPLIQKEFSLSIQGTGLAVSAIAVGTIVAFFVIRQGDRIGRRPLLMYTVLGYTIATPNEAEYQTMHLAVGAGDADFMAVSWDVLHDAFFQEAGGDAVMSKVGTLIDGAIQGYMVDKASYDAGVTDLSMLKDPEVAKRFDADGDGKADLAGCIPGWGCERVIETHLDALGLRDTVTHNQGAYPAMIAR